MFLLHWLKFTWIQETIENGVLLVTSGKPPDLFVECKYYQFCLNVALKVAQQNLLIFRISF